MSSQQPPAKCHVCKQVRALKSIEVPFVSPTTRPCLNLSEGLVALVYVALNILDSFEDLCILWSILTELAAYRSYHLPFVSWIITSESSTLYAHYFFLATFSHCLNM